jgi:hypothetical protein
MNEKIVESVGRGTVRLGEALRAIAQPPEITRVRVVKRDADGNVIEDVTVEYRDGNHG